MNEADKLRAMWAICEKRGWAESYDYTTYNMRTIRILFEHGTCYTLHDGKLVEITGYTNTDNDQMQVYMISQYDSIDKKPLTVSKSDDSFIWLPSFQTRSKFNRRAEKIAEIICERSHQAA